VTATSLRVMGGAGAVLVASLYAPARGRPVEEPPPRTAEPPPAVVAEQPQAPTGKADACMRAVEEPGKMLRLQVAARRFVAEGPAPRPEVTLVGVVHIGERPFYDQVQRLLGKQDLVLYESVMPPGARGAAGGDAARRPQSTRSTMGFVASLLGDFKKRNDRYPADLKELKNSARLRDARVAQWLGALADAWGRPIEYASLDQGRGFVLTSLGADGRPGGEDEAADLRVTGDTPLDPALAAWGADRIQGELAAALGLSFQLDAIDYGPDNFQCSDMDLDQLDAALRAEGADFGEIAGGLTGTSLFGKFAVFMLRLVRVADVFLDGAIADSMKVMVIELFSDETIIDELMARAGPGLAKVLIGSRNQVVVDDLKAAIERRPGLRSVAIFYGAGHMPDLAQRLQEQLGYRADTAEWFTAMEVDLARSAMGPEQLDSMRRMIRRQVRMGW
jgi:type II secretion system (T2SS) protein G